MNLTQNLSTINRTVYATRKIDYLVLHYFGALGSAAETCAYFKSVNRKASAHYFVDDDGVWQAVLDKDAAWHCGERGRGVLKDLCGNANSLGIEVRPYKVNTKSKLVSDADWYFTDKTLANTQALVRYLMDKYGIDADHLIRHYDVTAKRCPRPWVGDDVNTFYGKTGNQLWAEFKAGLEENMTGEQIYTALNDYLRAQPCPDWAKQALQEAIDAGITDGTRPCELIPRYQAAIMAKRAMKNERI